MTSTPERATLGVPGETDTLTCPCGNDSGSDGLYPCIADGGLCEPDVDGPWDGKLIVCLRCGRIIDQDSLLVVGRQVEDPTESTTKWVLGQRVVVTQNTFASDDWPATTERVGRVSAVCEMLYGGERQYSVELDAPFTISEDGRSEPGTYKIFDAYESDIIRVAP